MPELTVYGASWSNGSWSNGGAMTGAPDGSYTGGQSQNSYNRVNMSPFSTLPANAVITKVVKGMRWQTSGGTGGQMIASVTPGDTRNDAVVGTNETWGVPTTTEWELNPTLFTVAQLQAGLSYTVTKTTFDTVTYSVDSVWVRVTYTVPLVKRGTTVVELSEGGAGWSNSTYATDGAPGTDSGTYATWLQSVANAVGYIDLGGYDFSSIPDGATINSVTVTCRNSISSASRVSLILLQPFDGSTPIGVGVLGTLSVTAHNDSGPVLVTLAQLKSPGFKVRASFYRTNTTSSMVASVDHIDVSVDYTVGGPPLALISSYATTMVQNTGTTNPNNTLGPPDAVTATVSTSVSAYQGVRVGFDLSALPADAVVTQVWYGARISANGVMGDFQLILRDAANATVHSSPLLDPPNFLLDAEFKSATVMTAAQLKAGAMVSVNTRSDGSQVKGSAVDAVWLRVQYVGTAVVSRSRRWDAAAAKWVETPIKRFDTATGQWVAATTIKRWDATAGAWV